MSYCTIQDLRDILPKNVTIGTNLLDRNVNVLESQAEYWMDQTAGIIDSYLSAFYRIPLIEYKEPNYSVNPITFTEKYPPPIPLINARLAAAQIYDYVMMAQQTPNVSDWGKNMRALAFDDLSQIQAGYIQLKNQEFTGKRFVRQSLHDPSRMPAKGEYPVHNRPPGN